MESFRGWAKPLVLMVMLSMLGMPATVGAQKQGASSTQKVDINHADQEELESLPGIGPSLAGAILAYREEAGPFQRVEDLMNIRGIGEKKFEKLRPYVKVGKSSSSRD